MEERAKIIDIDFWEVMLGVLGGMWAFFWIARWYIIPILAILLFTVWLKAGIRRMDQKKKDRHDKRIIKEAIKEAKEEGDL